jgi:hypothetical protein
LDFSFFKRVGIIPTIHFIGIKERQGINRSILRNTFGFKSRKTFTTCAITEQPLPRRTMETYGNNAQSATANGALIVYGTTRRITDIFRMQKVVGNGCAANDAKARRLVVPLQINWSWYRYQMHRCPKSLEEPQIISSRVDC